MGPIVTSLRTDLALALLNSVWSATLSSVLPASRIALGNSVGNTPAPRLALPFIYVQPLTLPTFINAFTDETLKKRPVQYEDVAIVSVVVGREYKIRINGYPVKYTAQAGDTLTDIRDALDTAAQSLGEAVTTSLPDASTLRILPTSQGSLFSVTSPTSSALLTVVTTSEAEPALVTYKLGRRRVTVRINAYSEPLRTLSEGAHDILTKAYTALEDPAVIRAFRDYSMTFRPISEPLDLTGIRASESGKEQRGSFDLQIELPVVTVYPAQQIETVEISVSLDGAQSAPIDIPITVP